ncbi:MAG: ornithine cyclodeaminase family protein [Candidatus Asgardarchaeia archaeon]
MKDIEFIYLTQKEVEESGLTMKLVVETVEEVFRLHAENKVIVPSKVVLDLDEKRRGRINAMPAYVGGKFNVCGIKWIAGFPKNPIKYGMPRATGLLILNDSETGFPLAIMDCTLISAMRTGAVTGVGAKYLARPDSEIVAMIGAGVQARTQLLALLEVLKNLKEVRVYDIRKEASIKYSEEMSEKTGLKIIPVDTPKDAVVGADIIITVTVADEPIVKDKWVKEGSFFSHVGSYQEEEYEVVLHSDKIVVDEWEHVLHRGTPVLAKMYKEGLIKDEDIYANLGDIVIGKKPGRENPKERIFFAPIGMGSEDVAVGYIIYKNAKEKKLGVTLKLFGR